VVLQAVKSILVVVCVKNNNKLAKIKSIELI